MKVEIFFAENTRDSTFYQRDGKIYSAEQAKAAFNGGEYRKVTAFEHTSGNEQTVLHDAFLFTQNKDKPWSTPPQRSSQMGDIIKIGDVLYIVARGYEFEKL